MLWRTLLASILLASVCLAAPPPPAAEFRNGRWQPVETPATQPASDPELDRVEQLLKAQQNSVALKALLYWIKTHPKDAPLRDRAVFLLGQATYQLDDRIKAFYFFDEVMDEYPESTLFFPALEMQYKIADEYLKGHKQKFFGLPIIGSEDEAIEMLYRVQQRSPGSPLAERALLRTADWYYSNADYDLAHDAYGVYVKNYPRSPMVPQVKLRQAFSSLAQFRGTRFDPTPMLDARAELADIQAAYPDLAKEENVTSVMHAIDETLAEKLVVRADFYHRTHEPRAAVYVYRYLLAIYPQAPQAPKVKAALAREPQWALDQPEPRVGIEFNPPLGGAGGVTGGPQ
jgi:outer membrane assembly lipoprotein YfiO